MARGRGRRNQGMGAWVQDLGEQIGSQLGAIIAESVQRSLQSTINVGDIARQLGAGAGGRGRGRRAGQRAVCSVAGCGRPVLAKGLCRSHYYRARYKAQKAGTLQPRKRGRRSSSRKKTGSDSSGSESSSS
jgi:hypothetical protein